MAVTYERSALGGRMVRETWSETSAADTAITPSTDIAGASAAARRAQDTPRDLTLVTVRYDGNVSVTVSVTLKSHLGSTYDVLLAAIELSSQDEAVYQPDTPVSMAPGDQIQVTAPAGGANREASVVITTETESV